MKIKRLQHFFFILPCFFLSGLKESPALQVVHTPRFENDWPENLTLTCPSHGNHDRLGLHACLGSHSGCCAYTPELRRGGERLVLCDGEHQQEALAAAKVVVPDGGIVLLARRVQDVDLNVLTVQHHLLPVAVSLGGLVVLHEL